MARAPLVALALGAAAVAGVGAGVLAERAAMRRSVRAGGNADSAREGEPFGSLRSTPVTVIADDGARLHVEVDEPTGEFAPEASEDAITVIFCHGYCLNLDCWHYQRRDLRSLGRLVFWDQRGHGRSEPGPGGYGAGVIDRLALDLDAVIDTVAPVGPLVLVGHSMGGMTVMALARQRPDLFGSRVRGVALLGTSSGGLREVMLGLPASVSRVVHRLAPSAVATLSRNESASRLTRERATDLGLLLTHFYSFGSRVSPDVNRFTAEMISGTPLNVIADILPAFAEHDVVDALSVLHGVESVVIVGDADKLTPEQHSLEIVRHVPGAELIVLPDTGHMLMLERPAEVNEALRELMRRVRRSLA